MRGNYGLCKSSEFSDQEYSPAKYLMIFGRSDWKSRGSERNRRLGLNKSMKFLRLNRFLFIDSIFQDIDDSCKFASVFTELSDLGSLNVSGSVQDDCWLVDCNTP